MFEYAVACILRIEEADIDQKVRVRATRQDKSRETSRTLMKSDREGQKARLRIDGRT